MLISSLTMGLSKWSITARCIDKSSHVRSYNNDSGSGIYTFFVFQDQSGLIRVTAFGYAARPVHETIAYGKEYIIDSSAARIRRANPEYNDISEIEINIFSIDSIHEVRSLGMPSEPDEDLSTSLRSSARVSSGPLGASSTGPHYIVSTPRRVGPSFKTLLEVRALGDGELCDVRATVSSIEELDCSGLVKRRRITIIDQEQPGVSVIVTLMQNQAMLLDESQLERRPAIVLFDAIVRGDGDDMTLVVYPSTDAKVELSVPVKPGPSRDLTQENHRGPTRFRRSSSEASRRFTVFISHAGLDKKAVALPLHTELIRKRISCFVDKEDLRPGDDVPEGLGDAMEDAMTAVFILSPEFVARKWPFRELRRFIDRRDKAQRQGRIPPRIIPVFYRWSVEQCKKDDFCTVTGSNGEDVFRKFGFFEEARQLEAPTATVGLYLRKLAHIAGITSEDSDSLRERPSQDVQTELVESIASAVVESQDKIVGSFGDDVRRLSLTER